MNEDGDNTLGAPAEVVQRPLLVGRDKELAQVEAILEHRRPALITEPRTSLQGGTEWR